MNPPEINLHIAHSGYDGHKCYVHARAGISVSGEYVMTMQKLLLLGSDLFDEPELLLSRNGCDWSPVKHDDAFRPRATSPNIPYFLSVCDFTPAFHRVTGKLLGTGAEICYDLSIYPKKIISLHKKTAYAVYDDSRKLFMQWKTLEVPDKYFSQSRAGSTQRYDLDDGTILLPVYFVPPSPNAGTVMSSVIFKCAFDGKHLTVTDIGSPVSGEPDARGFYEPSVTALPGGGYLMTLRGDNAGYFAHSDNGLDYDAPEIWRFDDGSELGNYNTQQHFVRLGNRVYLVYTRRGANNDHVFRHRAPLFIGEIDCGSYRIIRESETILIPERGARLGNFGVTSVSPTECLVTAAEWMQPAGCEKYGSDNTVYVARIIE